jgi:hypothetical protein
MVHNISIYYSCVSNGLLSKELCPLEVNWCQNFTLIVSAVTFSYKLYFSPEVARWKSLSEFFYLRCRDIMYLVHNSLLEDFDCLKMSFRASKLPHKFMTFKNYKI